ncbi:MAG: GNAT family N-acetyltransferase [Treponema sp.]|nr:GNAT family N-acetyltransferase [Treponema sp.]MBQ6568019.1 GNAT family N-acetyltransferase [Treponema sp.]
MIRQIFSKKFALIFLSIYNDANSLLSPTIPPLDTPDVFLDQIKKQRNYVYILDGKVVGFMSFRKERRGAELTSLYVHPDSQGKGVGTALVAHFEKLTSSSKLHYIIALANSPCSHRFYRKCGYETRQELIKTKSWEIAFIKFNQAVS